jgi:diketogulonate reductase-like aldo/keto reductase
VVRIAQKLGKTPAQVLIRWSVQNGVGTIPKSTKKDRARENIEVRDK